MRLALGKVAENESPSTAARQSYRFGGSCFISASSLSSPRELANTNAISVQADPVAPMPRPKRQLLATVDETCNPPSSIGEGLEICKIIKAEGKNLYTVASAGSKPLLVELPARFRSSVWMKRGGYVLVNTRAFGDRENKLGGEIENVVGDEKAWRKMPYW